MTVSQQKIYSDKGRLTGVLYKKNDYLKLRDYIENLEDSLELAEAIKNSDGFKLWDDFVKEYKSKLQ